MADNAFVKIGTALLKHQVKKLVGEETLGVISEELANIGGDKLDAWLGDNSTIEEIEKAAKTAEACFHDSIGDHELEQWMVSLPIGDLPKVLEAIEKLPTSPDEKGLEDAIRESVAGWRKLFPEQTDKAVNSFLSCLRSALLPIEKQTLMVIGRSVLRIEDKVDRLAKLVEQLKPYSPETSSQSRLGNEITVGRDVLNSVIVDGNNNVINYYAAVEKNTEKHEPDYWALKHPYPMPPNFTGRIAERATLTHWLKEDSENRLFILRALGGFGKSALTWQWLTYDIDPKEYPKLVFWSFYEGDASFEHFIEETLKYLKLEVPQGQRLQVDELLKAMQAHKILLIMDGFERILRLYGNINAAYQSDEEQKIEDNKLDCKDFNAEWFLKGVCTLPNLKSKVLMTTRLIPRAIKPRGELLQGCHEEELTAMQKEDAVEFFYKQGIKGNRAEIEAACTPYDYHPLSLRILAGLITNDRERPGDIAVADELDITEDIVQNKNHVLDVAYRTLSFAQQKLLSNMACFRSSIRYQVLKVITNKPSWKRKNHFLLSEKLDDILQILESRGLLNWDRRANKYYLHPIVRRYAYVRLTELDRIAAHARLRDYFAAVDVPAKLQNLDDLSPVIELYNHTVQVGNYDQAAKLYSQRVMKTLFFQFGVYQIAIELIGALFQDGEDKPPRLKDELWQGWAMNELGNSYSLSGQPRNAAQVFESATQYAEKLVDKRNLAIALGNLAHMAQFHLGALNAAEFNLHRRIEIGTEIPDEFIEAVAHRELGRLLAYRGLWTEAENELDIADKLFVKNKYAQSQTIGLGFRALYSILLTRDPLKPKTNNFKSTIKFCQDTLKLVEGNAQQDPVERDFIRAQWLLGAVYRLDNQLELAEQHLNIALMRCRTINLVETEANILLDIARLRYDQKKYEEAKSLADEALLITERCGYVLQGADVNLFLAQYALEQEKDKVKTKEYAEEALKLATCDGPPYYYKVAYEEAERMLKDLA